ncbi:MAG: DMT family transporter [Phycisphaerae bacterium]|nr:DMT family transporter [Phycisphaerae bacterium]
MLSFSPVHLGYAAGLATSVLWTGTSLFFTAAGRRISPVLVNAARIALAVVLHGVTFRLLADRWLPAAEPGQIAYLAASGVIGLSLGDQALFTAFLDIGPRRSTLLMTTAPLMAALFGWMALGETLSVAAWMGVALTIAGVAWVILERPASAGPRETGARQTRGVILALIGAACQAGGLLLSKQGMGHGWLPVERHLPPQTATLVRMSFAAVGMLPVLLIHGLRERKRRAAGVIVTRTGSPAAGWAFAACGCVVGPYLGVWMSLVAGDRAPIGVAQTLCSLTPVFILPLAHLIHREHITPRAALGALAAVAGCGLLFWEA